MPKIVADKELAKRIEMIFNHTPAVQPIIGANCGGKPEFSGYWLGHGGSVGGVVQLVLRLPSNAYTLTGIKENRTVSVNMPTPEMMDEAIYLGNMNRGPETPSRAEKTGLKVFYGKLGTAPMLAKSPVCFECTVNQIFDCGSHQLVLAGMQYVHVEKKCLPASGTLSSAKGNTGMPGGADSIEFLNKVNPIYRYHVFDKKQPGRDVRSFLAIWTSPDGTDKDLAKISWVADPPPTPANTERFEPRRGKK